MAKGKKKSIERNDYAGKSRKNNTPVGLVTSDNDRDAEAKTYAYDPHLDRSIERLAHLP
jgi:YD repeat-containing protein